MMGAMSMSSRPPAPPASPAAPTVRLVEVGPRDGLQNERQAIATATKLALIRRLAAAGLKDIEATAFVSPKWVPQMADHAEVMAGLPSAAEFPGVNYPVLTPNLKGFEAALAAGAREVAVFAAASEAFSQKNINCTVAESIARFEPILAAAQTAGVRVRGYISCVLGCPYQGEVAPEAVAAIARELLQMGCFEVSLGDTIGIGTPAGVQRLIGTVGEQVPVARLAGHFHDTWGMGVANVAEAWRQGVRVFDSSVAGLGGCPYAKGATGNVATEDLVWLLHGLGESTGVDLEALAACGEWICAELGRPNGSRAGRALRARCAA